MKGGTSSLVHMLRQHPDIYMPEREVHFFDVDERYNQGLEAYGHFFEGWQDEKAIGEKTPTYSYKNDVPERIFRNLPEVKLIWIFREPVKRAYSHYWFFVGMGKERLSFEDAIKREADKATKDFTMRYLDRSIYIAQVERYLRFFSRDQMLFLKFEDFLQNHLGILNQACSFLGVSTDHAFSEYPRRENATQIPRSVSLQWLAYHMFHRKGARVLRWMKKINRKVQPGYPSLSVDVRQELQAMFSPYNTQLANITGLDLSEWDK